MENADAVGVTDQYSRDGGSVVQDLQSDVVVPDVEGGRGIVQGTLHLRTRGVTAGVHDAATGMAALPGQCPLAGGALVESGAVGDQVGHRLVAVGDDRAHRVFVTESGAGRQGVGDMGLDRVVGVG